MDSSIAPLSKYRKQLAQLRKENDVLFDYESPDGNKAARSHVYKLRRSKSAVEKARKEAKAEALEYGRKVDTEAKSIMAMIEEMMKVHTVPLEAVAQKEKDRVEAIHVKIREMSVLAIENTLPKMIDNLAILEAIEIDDSFAEFVVNAAKEKDSCVSKLKTLIMQAKEVKALEEKKEAERFEAERLAKKKREDMIKREAAQKAKEAAEERARKAKEIADRKAREEKEAIEKKLAAAKLAAANEKLRARKAKEAADKKIEEARLAKEAAERKAEADQNAKELAILESKKIKEAVERRAKKDKERAVIAERVRICKENEARALKENKAREAAERIKSKKAHRTKIHEEALVEVMKLGFSREDGVKLILSVSKGEVPNMSVNY